MRDARFLPQPVRQGEGTVSPVVALFVYADAGSLGNLLPRYGTEQALAFVAFIHPWITEYTWVLLLSPFLLLAAVPPPLASVADYLAAVAPSHRIEKGDPAGDASY